MAAVTIAEIQCGIGQVDDQTVAVRVQDWLDGMLRDGQPRIAEFDVRAAILLGRMWTTPSLNNFIANDPRSRRIKSGADLAIAATAIAGQMVVVTGNVNDFLVINATFPLPGLFNPIDRQWAVEAAGVTSPRSGLHIDP
jgi:predicted nucleic acid-binding protein